MDNEKILDLIVDIDLLYKYAEFIPNSYKSTFNQSLNNIKLQLKELIITKTTKEDDTASSPNIYDQSLITNQLENTYTKVFEEVLEFILVTNNTNEKNSLKNLLKDQDKSFLDFIDYYQDLESKKEISFSKSDKKLPNRGWIKTGELLINSGVIDLDSLERAINHKNSKNDLFLGEAMIELKVLNENNLRKALKTQRWLFKICEEINKQ